MQTLQFKLAFLILEPVTRFLRVPVIFRDGNQVIPQIKI